METEMDSDEITENGNSEAGRKMRRYRTSLMVSGLGVAAFGLWSLLKVILYAALNPQFFEGIPGMSGLDSSERTIVFVITFIIAGIDCLFRIYTGLSARAVGKGKKRGKTYFIFAVVIVISSLVGIAFFFFPGSYSYSQVDTFVSVIVEITSLAAALELVFSAVAVRRLSAKREE